MRQQKIFAALLQETWQHGERTRANEGYLFIEHGLKEKECHRGSQGVAIVLSPAARKSWELAGSQVLKFGARILATRLKIVDTMKRPLIIFLVSAYAPDSGRSSNEREAYADDLQRCFQACGRDILVMGTDANASIGVRSQHDISGTPEYRVCGQHGIAWENAAGQRLRTLLGAHELSAATTFFRRTARGRHATPYDTWHHNRTGNPYQLDHFFVKQKDMKRVRDAGPVNWGVDSDHRAILLRMEIASCTHPRTTRPAGRVDRALLRVVETAVKWRGAVSRHVAALGGSGSKLAVLEAAMVLAAKEELLDDGRRRPGWFIAAQGKLMPLITKRNEATRAQSSTRTTEGKMKLQRARKEVKRAVDDARAAWVRRTIDIIQPPGDARPPTPKVVWDAIRLLQRGPDASRPVVPMMFYRDQGDNSNKEACATQKESGEVMVESLKQTFSQTGTFDAAAIAKVRQREQQPWMDKAPTEYEVLAATAKLSNGKSGADAECPAEYWKALHGDSDLNALVHQIVVAMWESGSYGKLDPANIPDKPPEPLDVREPVLKLAERQEWKIEWQQANPKRPGSATWARYETYKHTTTIEAARACGCTTGDLPWAWQRGDLLLLDPALEADGTPMAARASDDGGLTYAEWSAARLVLLPKKGDLMLTKNWRGICLLDIGSKILSNVMVKRMQALMEQVGFEMQTGFRPERGTIDGLFAVMMGLKKRQEHDLETWGVYVDLVKAFDTVNREALWEVLRRFGIPDHFVNMLVRLHENAVIKVQFGEEDTEVDSSIGVRQGSCEGPILFLFIMQAALETMEWPVAKPTFQTRADGVTTGERPMRKRGVTSFELFASLFADDCALFFESRADMVTGTSYLFNHLRKFGLKMHVGSGATASKTEAMYYPPTRLSYDDGDTTPFTVFGPNGEGLGFVSFTKEFKYLGSLVHHSLTSDADVNKRVKSAAAAFGSLRSVLCNYALSEPLRGAVYSSLVLTILLYGSEVWCLREDLFAKLRTFHNSCCRAMCRITMAHTIRHHIPSKQLYKRLGIAPVDQYYHRRLLRWAGHVSRMPMSRAPRQLLTGWVAHPRPTGSPPMTFGRTLKKALVRCGQSPDFGVWSKVAADRVEWRKLFDQTPLMPRPKPTAYAEQVRDIFYGPPPPPNFFAAAPPQIPPTTPADAHTPANNLAALLTDPPLPPPPIPIQIPNANLRPRRSTADYTQNYEE